MDAAFGQKFHNIRVRQAETKIPPHGKGDDVVGEAVATEGRDRARRLPPPARPALVHLPARAVAPGLDERLLRAPLAPHAAPPLCSHQATAGSVGLC